VSVMNLIPILSIFYYFSSFLSSPLHSILHTIYISHKNALLDFKEMLVA